MDFTVACNWQDDLIERIDYPEVKSLFGGLPDTIISGGRYSGMINFMEKEQVKTYIQKVHDKGWEFSFNVNSTCLGNKELTPSGYKEIVKYLENIVNLGVDSLTVSLPNLLAIIKKHFPEIKTKISTYQKINSVAMARRFEDLGADSIMLSEHINRDFKLLKAIRKAVKCKTIVIANVGCIFGCPNMFTHSTSIAHSGAKSEKASNPLVEMYSMNCLMHRLKNPTEFIKTRWIRPEDLGIYEEIGIDMIKIIDRHSSTEALAERVKAYHDRSFNGNLVNLLGQMLNANKNMELNADYVFNDVDSKGVRKLRGIFKTLSQLTISDLIYLDNKKIPKDFLDKFSKQNCAMLSCDNCSFCGDIASAAINIKDTERQKELAYKLESINKEIADGSLLY